jgi:hypothetical protein
MDSSDEEVDRAEESQGGGRVVRKWTDRWGRRQAPAWENTDHRGPSISMYPFIVWCAPFGSQDMTPRGA